MLPLRESVSLPKALLERPGRISFHKIKSHLKLPEALSLGYTEAGWAANQAADKYADTAAANTQHCAADIERLRFHDERAEKVHSVH